MGDNKYVIDYGDGPLKQAQEQLGLVDLVNRVKAAPTEQAIKEQELRLKQNDVSQIETKNLLQLQQLKSAVYDEERKKNAYENDLLLKIREGFQQGGKEMGERMLVQTFGKDAFVVDKGNGAFAISVPGSAPISIAPGGTTDPKEIESQTQSRIQAWNKMGERYQNIYIEGKNLKAQLALATAAGDISAIYAKAKMQDPGGRVTDGDYKSVMESPNVTEEVKNMLTRALKQEGPILGPADSITRKNFLASAETQIRQEKDVFEPQAKFFLENYLGKDPHLDPEKIMFPKGDITLEALSFQKQKKKFGSNEIIPAPASAVKPEGTQPVKPVAPPEPVYNLDTMLEGFNGRYGIKKK